MRKLALIMAIMLIAGSAQAYTVHSLNLVNAWAVPDGEGVAYDATSGHVVTADGSTLLRFWDHTTGVEQSTLAVTGLPSTIRGIATLPNTNFIVGVDFDVWEVNRNTGVGTLLYTAGNRNSGIAVVDGNDFHVSDQNLDTVTERDAAGTPLSATWTPDANAGAGGAGVDDCEGLGWGPDGNLFVADDGGDRVVSFDPVTKAFVAEYGTEDLGWDSDPEGIATDGTHLYISNDSGTQNVMKLTLQSTSYDTSPPPAMTFDNEYMVIGTSDDAGGDAIYSINPNGTLNLLQNIAGSPGAPNACRTARYDEANDTLFFTDGNDNNEFQVGLADLLANGLAAASAGDTQGWNANGAESKPSHVIVGPQDGKLYAVAGGAGWMWRFEDGSPNDTMTKMTSVVVPGIRHMLSVYGNTAYMKDGDNDFFTWEQNPDGTWNEMVHGGPNMLGAADIAIRQSDGIVFSGRSGSVQFAYIDGSIPLEGQMWKLDPLGLGAYNSLEISADGQRLYVGFPQAMGFYDISGDAATWDDNVALWTTVYDDGFLGRPSGLLGNDWRISIIGTNIQLAPEDPPIPEPAGLGLIGLSLLALKKRRR